MKHSFDRRQFLAGSAGALSVTLLPKGVFAARQATGAAKAPVARIDSAHDTYFGETLSDPYRWMENAKDPEWLPFLKGQNDRTREVLDALPTRASLLERIQQLSGDTVATSRVQRAGGLLFFTQRPKGADNFKLFVRQGGGTPDRVLVDPIGMSGAKGHVSLDWWRASPNGRHVVYGLSQDGSEDSILHVLNVADGRDLPHTIANTESANPQWLDDGSGFFYNQLTGKVGTPERYLDSQARFHRLGSDPGTDPVLMKRGLVAGIDYEKIQQPNIVTSPGAHYAILLLSDVRPEARGFIAPLDAVINGRAHWTPFAAFEDEVTDVDLHGEDLYLLVNKGTPRGRLVKTSAAAPNLATAIQVVPQGPFVIESTSRAWPSASCRRSGARLVTAS